MSDPTDQYTFNRLQEAENFLQNHNVVQANKLLLPLLNKQMLTKDMLKRIIVLLIHHNNYDDSVSRYFEEYFKISEKQQYYGHKQQQQSDQSEYYFLYARYLQNKNKLEQAQIIYEKCCRIYSQNSQVYLQYATFLVNNFNDSHHQQLALQKLQNAIKLIQGQNISLSQQNIQYYAQYAKMLFNNSQFVKSFQVYIKVIQYYQNSNSNKQQLIQCLYQAGITQKSSGNYQSAQRYIERAISIQQKNEIQINPYHFLSLGEILISLDKRNQALKCYQKCIQIIPEDVETLRKYGILLAMEGKYAMSINIMEQILKYQPNYPNNYYNYSLILTQCDKIQKSLQVLQKGLSNPNLINKAQLLKLYAYIQTQYYGNHQKAKQIYQKSLQNNPLDFQNLYNMAICLTQSGQYSYSQQIYLKIVDILSKNDFNYTESINYQKTINGYGILLTHMQKYKQAQSKFQESLAFNQTPQTLYNYGLLLCNQKKFLDALEKFDKAHQLQPYNPLFILMMGVIHYQIQQYKQAKNHFTQANRLLSQQQNNHPIKRQQIPSINKPKYGLKQFQIDFIKQNLKYYTQMMSEYQSLLQSKKRNKKMREISSVTTASSVTDSQIESISHNFVDLLSSVTTKSHKPKSDSKQIPEWKSAMQQMKKQMMKEIRYLHEENRHLKRELTQKVIQIEGQVFQMKQELLWYKQFDNKLQVLEIQRKMRAHSYGRKMCWMLCSSIQAYRSLKLGIVSAGSDVILSKTGGFIQKVASICDFVSDYPVIGQVCGIVSKFAGLYVSMQQDIVIQKVIQATNRYYQQQLLSKAATQAAQYLIDDIRHIQILENPKQNQNILQNFEQFANKQKQKVLGEMLQINLKQDQKQALVDCSVIIAYLIKTDNTNIKQNILKCAARAMLSAKLQKNLVIQQKRDLRKQKDNEKQIIENKNKMRKAPVTSVGCCTSNDCSIM